MITWGRCCSRSYFRHSLCSFQKQQKALSTLNLSSSSLNQMHDFWLLSLSKNPEAQTNLKKAFTLMPPALQQAVDQNPSTLKTAWTCQSEALQTIIEYREKQGPLIKNPPDPPSRLLTFCMKMEKVLTIMVNLMLACLLTVSALVMFFFTCFLSPHLGVVILCWVLYSLL